MRASVLKRLVLLLFTLLTTPTLALYNGGVGHADDLKVANLSDYSNAHFKVNFIEHNQDDFNGDWVPDRVICGNTMINNKRRINIRVIDGKTNQNLYVWNWGEAQAEVQNGKAKIAVTGCDIVHLRPNRPSIIVSTAYIHNTLGVRVMAPQFIIHNLPSTNKLNAKHIRIPGTNAFFRSASRSVKCTQVPAKLRQVGVKDGAYCFYAGYDSELGFSRGYGTATAFVKFEEGTNNNFIVKDLTNDTGLPWNGGMLGTQLRNVRQVRLCSGSRKYDGLHMMGGAFLDYNRDGLIDLLTVGQHASIRGHEMILNSSKSEKFYFKTGYVADVNNSNMSEFLRILALDENEKYASSSCVYISGEKFNGCGSVPDHMRCFKNGKWETKFPEGEQFSSTMFPMTVKANGSGLYVVKTAKVVNGKKVADKFLKVGGAYEKKLVLSVGSKPAQSQSTVTVNGWACVPNTRWRPRITVSSRAHHKEAGYVRYYQSITNIKSEPMLSKRCLQPNTYPLRFRAVIPKSKLNNKARKIFIQADFYHSSTINMPHVNKVISY